VTTKFCNHCQAEFDRPGDHWYSDGKCKIAVRARQRAYAAKLSPDKVAQQKQVQATWRKANAEYLKRTNAEWRNTNREAWLAGASSWYHRNRDKVLRQRKGYARRRERVDPLFKLERRLRTRLYLAVRRQIGRQRVQKDIGCTLEELRAHLEAQFRDGMTWDNHGTVWEIDHIYPLSKIDLSTEEGQHRANHFSNLQPLLVAENRRKAARVEYQER
jgi:hypothetical protein